MRSSEVFSAAGKVNMLYEGAERELMIAGTGAIDVGSSACLAYDGTAK